MCIESAREYRERFVCLRLLHILAIAIDVQNHLSAGLRSDCASRSTFDCLIRVYQKTIRSISNIWPFGQVNVDPKKTRSSAYGFAYRISHDTSIRQCARHLCMMIQSIEVRELKAL